MRKSESFTASINQPMQNSSSPSFILTTEELHRLLVLHRYFVKRSSPSNPKSVHDISAYLESVNLKTSRATLYRDLEKLPKLTGKEVFHKKNKIPFEIGEGEYEICEKSGFYYNDNYSDTLNLFPIPITEEQFSAIKRLKYFAKSIENKQIYDDLQTLSDLLEKFNV